MDRSAAGSVSMIASAKDAADRFVRSTHHLPPHQGDWDQSHGVERVHELAHRESLAQLARAVAHEALHFDLAGHVARAVRGLLQVEMLPSAHRLRVEPE